MRANTALFFAAASFFSQVAATIYVTQPVASTTCQAGAPCMVAWNDDGNAPPLATIGACDIELCIGDVTTQICLQDITPSLDVSQNAQIPFNPDATIGGNSNDYFIKFISQVYKDPTNPTFPYTSFSAKFTLAGMTGTFNATVSAAIAGASVAPAATSVSAVAATPAAATASAGTMTKAASSTVAATATAKATTSAAKSSSTSGAVNVSSSMSIVSLVAVIMSAAFMGL
ncbi:hypothetical protein FRB98_005408 [Tulasnella sp. 332]|nr:hypothetical protein FRB98_005408 [Tulasnella sp. 332]